MDLEWLLPQQIDQILKLCDLSSIQDLSVAANILEQHSWNLELALHDIVEQNDQIKKQEARKVETQAQRLQKPSTNTHVTRNFQPFSDSEEFQLGPEHYEALGLTQNVSQPQKDEQFGHKHILSQQNKQYAEMQKNYHAKKQEEHEWSAYTKLKEKQYQQERESFSMLKIQKPIQIKFRLPHKVEVFTFDKQTTVSTVFKYVSGHFRDGFEHRYCQFDLTQNFPPLSLKGKMQMTLLEVFDNSDGEVVIVKQE